MDEFIREDNNFLRIIKQWAFDCIITDETGSNCEGVGKSTPAYRCNVSDYEIVRGLIMNYSSDGDLHFYERKLPNKAYIPKYN